MAPTHTVDVAGLNPADYDLLLFKLRGRARDEALAGLPDAARETTALLHRVTACTSYIPLIQRPSR